MKEKEDEYIRKTEQERTHSLSGHAYGTALRLLQVLLAFIVCTVLIPAAAGFQWLTVTSGSMEPAFGAGTAILVHSCPAAGLKEGDIVTCSLAGSGKKVTHRVVRIEEDTGRIVTRGDANSTEDPPTSPDRILGKVWLAVPGAGYALLFMGTLHGKLVLGCLGLICIIPVQAVQNSKSAQITTRKRRQIL